MTKRQYYEILMDVAPNDDVRAFIRGEIEELDKKLAYNKTHRKSKARLQKEEFIKQRIEDYLNYYFENKFDADDIRNIPILVGYTLSQNMVTTLCRQLVEEGRINRVVIGRKTYYRSKNYKPRSVNENPTSDIVEE